MEITNTMTSTAAYAWSGRSCMSPVLAAQGTGLPFAGLPTAADDRQAATAAVAVKHQVPPPRERTR